MVIALQLEQPTDWRHTDGRWCCTAEDTDQQAIPSLVWSSVWLDSRPSASSDQCTPRDFYPIFIVTMPVNKQNSRRSLYH